jgi:malonyl-CoA/methylmalonyl-CoA synthetase
MDFDFFPAINSSNEKIAIVEDDQSYSYASLDQKIHQFARNLLDLIQKSDLEEDRIALYLPASANYVIAMHGIWRAGGIVLPLNVASAPLELEYYLTSTTVSKIISVGKYLNSLRELSDTLGIELLSVDEVSMSSSSTDNSSSLPLSLPLISSDRRAMILFTSGTTSKPKGVVTTHRIIRSQILSLIEAWEWSSSDSIPLFLPVHHIHGIINILSSSLWIGATLYPFVKFDIPKILNDIKRDKYTLFMAVPTVYVKLIQYLTAPPPPPSSDSLSSSSSLSVEKEKQEVIYSFQKMRLHVSGSAACPVTLFKQWHDLTGQILLERYGMTEIGMALSNPLHGDRHSGSVGFPLPGVEIGLFSEEDTLVETTNTPGEIRVRGSGVFLEYWNHREVTEKAFKDGWFCTGDVATRDEQGYYLIMGRSSMDIIKSGGYKLSALEIESALLEHPLVSECAVVGLPDEVWGESVAVAIVLNQSPLNPSSDNIDESPGLSLSDLKEWSQGRMSAYKIPKHLLLIPSLPRNAMGKVTKQEVKRMFAETKE